jgi:uncharacterized protein (DUF4415 family)
MPLSSLPEIKLFISSVCEKQIQERQFYMNKKNPELADSENPNWDLETFRRSRSAMVVLPQIFNAKTSKELLKPRGRPKLENPKERINIRLSHEVIQYFKSSGDGWQTRIDAALREFIQSKPSTKMRS